MAAGKDSKGKNLIKKRFPKLGRVSKISSAGGGGIPALVTLNPTSGWDDGGSISPYITNYVAVSGTNPITLKCYGSVVTSQGGGTLEYTVTSTSGVPGTWASVSFDFNAKTSISLTSGQYVAFKIARATSLFEEYLVSIYDNNNTFLDQCQIYATD